jgi:hypothetical protein
LKPGHEEGGFLVKVYQTLVFELRQAARFDLELPVVFGKEVLLGDICILFVVIVLSSFSSCSERALFLLHGLVIQKVPL